MTSYLWDRPSCAFVPPSHLRTSLVLFWAPQGGTEGQRGLDHTYHGSCPLDHPQLLRARATQSGTGRSQGHCLLLRPSDICGSANSPAVTPWKVLQGEDLGLIRPARLRLGGEDELGRGAQEAALSLSRVLHCSQPPRQGGQAASSVPLLNVHLLTNTRLFAEGGCVCMFRGVWNIWGAALAQWWPPPVSADPSPSAD